MLGPLSLVKGGLDLANSFFNIIESKMDLLKGFGNAYQYDDAGKSPSVNFESKKPETLNY